MLAGTKPMSMFVEPIDSEVEVFAEQDFDDLVTQKKLIKRVAIEYIGKQEIRRILYALPSEEWRIRAMLLVQEVYASLPPGGHPDLERLIGLLLGYRHEDIEGYIEWLFSRSVSKPT